MDSLDQAVMAMMDDKKLSKKPEPESVAIFDDIKNKIEEIKRDVRVAVQVAILEEFIRFELGRLAQLKPDRAEAYQQMLAILGA